MKQDATPPPPLANSSRLVRSASKAKDLPQDSAKSVPPDVKKSSSKAVRRSLVFGRPRSGDSLGGAPQRARETEEPRVVVARAGPTRPAAAREQLVRPRRVRAVETVEEKWRRELKEKVVLGENTIKNLESEVSGLREELEKARGLNSELGLRNQKLSEDLAVAEKKIAALSSRESQMMKERESNGEYQSPKFKEIQKPIANKLETPKVMMPRRPESPRSLNLRVADNSLLRKSLPPPPPPPLPPSQPRARGGASTQKAPAIFEFYQFLTRQEGKKDRQNAGSSSKLLPGTTSAHSSIVGEIQNRSAHLLAIKTDIETKGELINSLIQKILTAAYTDIEDVLRFMDWVDGELSSLADERAVLKHFNWPEKKADAMREAAVEYRSLKILEEEISSFKDDRDVPCETAQRKMANLLDKSERSIQRLNKLRNSALRSYQEHKIPTDWMLDSGIVTKIKQASMKLAKAYMKRVTLELESVRRSDREAQATQEALLLQGVHFAYRAHQFVGGLDSETLCAFEEIRQRVSRAHGGSPELLAGIPSS
ncbi:hypothetical protein SAY87_028151 [Trapa incisa]|uniref:Protein CHUP1, chloroplastic n=1 Tax=Trapa incisa TaxID=236973 RepID=A0AAN7QNR0_9MYRT|nr:hypothetical protein SAY87_028151 [Trapa incisa]